MAVLTSSDNSVEKKRVPLSKEPVIIGRHPDCNIHIDDGSVSRHHAQVSFDGGSYFLQDLNQQKTLVGLVRGVLVRLELVGNDATKALVSWVVIILKELMRSKRVRWQFMGECGGRKSADTVQYRRTIVGAGLVMRSQMRSSSRLS